MPRILAWQASLRMEVGHISILSIFLEGCYSSFETHLKFANYHELYFFEYFLKCQRSLESNIIWSDLVETQFFSGLMIPQTRLYVVIFSVLNKEQVKERTNLLASLRIAPHSSPFFISFFFVLASRQPSKAFRRSTRSPVLKRPKVWTASTRGCHHGGMHCPPTLASTRSTRRCPQRPTAPMPRGARAGAATSSEEGRTQVVAACHRRGGANVVKQ